MSVSRYNSTTGELEAIASGSRTWVGTKSAYQAEKQAGTLPTNCLVVITDDEVAMDTEPTAGSPVAVTSDGIYNAFINNNNSLKQHHFVSQYNLQDARMALSYINIGVGSGGTSTYIAAKLDLDTIEIPYTTSTTGEITVHGYYHERYEQRLPSPFWIRFGYRYTNGDLTVLESPIVLIENPYSTNSQKFYVTIETVNDHKCLCFYVYAPYYSKLFLLDAESGSDGFHSRPLRGEYWKLSYGNAVPAGATAVTESYIKPTTS